MAPVLRLDLELLADGTDDCGGGDDGLPVAADHDLADCGVLFRWPVHDALEFVPFLAEAGGDELALGPSGVAAGLLAATIWETQARPIPCSRAIASWAWQSLAAAILASRSALGPGTLPRNAVRI